MTIRRRIAARVTAVATMAVLVVALGAGTSSAHPTRSFSACAAYHRHARACIDYGAAYLYGDTVYLRGRVKPPHSAREAIVVRRKPRSSTWEHVARVSISDTGRMRWAWKTRRADADQGKPYRFRFKIPGHGRSNIVELYVLFGE